MIKKGEQVFLSYGGLPNLMLLNQFGFVLPGLATDFGLVQCESLVSEDSLADRASALRGGGGWTAHARRRRRRRGDQLLPTGRASASGGAACTGGGRRIPAILLSDEEEDGDGAADSVAEARATVAYKALLQRTLDGYSTTAAEDRAALAEEGGTSLPPRTQLAMQFRLSQRNLHSTPRWPPLPREASSSGNLEDSREES